MTLNPESRVLSTDILRPPTGFRLDAAVGTTYTLDLNTALLAMLSFAASDDLGTSEHGVPDPLRAVAAAQQYAKIATIFCEAGGIAVPNDFPRVMTFLEDAVLEAINLDDEAIFHPKTWALRFADGHGKVIHRLAVLSRNLTRDNSWDTALVLDEAEGGAIDGAPLRGFIEGLVTISALNTPRNSAAEDRRAQIESLAASIAEVRFSAPEPFSSGTLIPQGAGSDAEWPATTSASKILAISPFLTRGALPLLGGPKTKRTLITRPEAADLVGPTSLADWKVLTLAIAAEPDLQAAQTDKKPTDDLPGWAVSAGLHAKTVVMDMDSATAQVVTGSANLTGSPWSGSVEFDVALLGPKGECGVDATLEGGGVPLIKLLEPYAPDPEAPSHQAEYALEREIDRIHRRVARAAPTVDVIVGADDRCEARLTIDGEFAANSQVWPASLDSGHRKPLQNGAHWSMARAKVTPFLVIETTNAQDEITVTRRTVVNAQLKGTLGDRSAAVVADIIKASPANLMRYLALLLDNPASASSPLLRWAPREPSVSSGVSGSAAPPPVAVLEPLLRAASRDPEAMDRASRFLGEVLNSSDHGPALPEGLTELLSALDEGRKTFDAKA